MILKAMMELLQSSWYVLGWMLVVMVGYLIARYAFLICLSSAWGIFNGISRLIAIRRSRTVKPAKGQTWEDNSGNVFHIDQAMGKDASEGVNIQVYLAGGRMAKWSLTSSDWDRLKSERGLILSETE